LIKGLDLTTQEFWLPPCTIFNTMNGRCGQEVSLYYCPSQPNGSNLDSPSSTYNRCRGNYVVCFGEYYDDVPGRPNQPLAMFGEVNGNHSNPQKTKILSIKDGTSNTLMMSEYLMASSHEDDDWRGDIQNDGGTNHFMTFTTPNSTVPDVVGWSVDNHDPRMPVTQTGEEFNAARSYHTGGVNAIMADGSVHFIADNISLATWRALGTMNGDDLPGTDFRP
jgi:prepilin-type processing-associated H-X9-DG protein